MERLGIKPKPAAPQIEVPPLPVWSGPCLTEMLSIDFWVRWCKVAEAVTVNLFQIFKNPKFLVFQVVISESSYGKFVLVTRYGHKPSHDPGFSDNETNFCLECSDKYAFR